MGQQEELAILIIIDHFQSTLDLTPNHPNYILGICLYEIFKSLCICTNYYLSPQLKKIQGMKEEGRRNVACEFYSHGIVLQSCPITGLQERIKVVYPKQCLKMNPIGAQPIHQTRSKQYDLNSPL